MEITDSAEFKYFKKQFTNLYDLNQRLKLISDVYYISHANELYMHSTVDFIEKFGRLNIDVHAFFGCMILPNKMYEFKKKLKVSKLRIFKFDDKYEFHDQDGDILEINRLIPHVSYEDESAFISQIEKEKELIRTNIIPKMYRKYFEIIQMADSHDKNGTLKSGTYEDNIPFENLGEESVRILLLPEAVTVINGGISFIITKNLFFDIKKEDELSVSFDISHTEYKMYNVFKQSNKLYELYTLTATRIPKNLARD